MSNPVLLLKRIIGSISLKALVAFCLLVRPFQAQVPDCQTDVCYNDYFFLHADTLLMVVLAAWLLVSASIEVFRNLLGADNLYHNVEMPTPFDPNELVPPRFVHSNFEGFLLSTNDA